MSWITIVWSMNAAACLTLAGIYLVVWCKQRQVLVHLLFSLLRGGGGYRGVRASDDAFQDSRTIRSFRPLDTCAPFGAHVAFVAFVRRYLHAGRPWFAWSICGLRTLVLILNFISALNLTSANYQASGTSHGGRRTDFGAVGIASPWGLLSSVSLLLLLIFSVDATITVWRRGDRRRALLIGGSMIFGAMLAWHVPLVIWGILDVPFFLGFTYSAIVAVMGYELSNDRGSSSGSRA